MPWSVRLSPGWPRRLPSFDLLVNIATAFMLLQQSSDKIYNSYFICELESASEPSNCFSIAHFKNMSGKLKFISPGLWVSGLAMPLFG